MLLAATERRRRQRVALRWVLPIAAVLAAGTAWAAATGRLPAWVEAVTGRSAHEPAPVPSTSAGGAFAVPANAGEPQAAASASRRAAEERAYRDAHEAHFVSRDPGRALAAWDAYLAAYPSGRFAPEARYNRALMLVRLGRRHEAREALRPFAEADPGGYRRAEARQLLDALE